MVLTLLGIDKNNHFTFLGNFYGRKEADKYMNELNYHKYALFYSNDTQRRMEIYQDDDIISVETRRHNAFEAQQQEHKLKTEDNELKQKEKSDKEFNDFLNSKTFSKLSQKEQEQIKENTDDLYQVLKPSKKIKYNPSLDPDADKIREEQGEKNRKRRLEIGEEAYSLEREIEYHKHVRNYCEAKMAEEKNDKATKTAAVALQWIQK